MYTIISFKIKGSYDVSYEKRRGGAFEEFNDYRAGLSEYDVDQVTGRASALNCRKSYEIYNNPLFVKFLITVNQYENY